MNDKDTDRFFDTEADSTAPQENLLAMIDKFDKPHADSFEAGDKARGTIVRMGAEYAFVDIGAKTEAMIARNEICDKTGALTAHEGDTVEAYIVSTTSDEIMLSRSLGGRKGGISELIRAHQSGVPVDGKVTGVNKGGFNVSIMGHRAFCPISQIDTKYVEDPNAYLSQSYSFAISRITEGGRNIVVSRIPVLEKDLEKRMLEIEQMTAEKKTVQGTITRIAPFGLFVDIGGFEGLVHISEVSWERAENLSESFTPGSVVECMLLKVERSRALRESKISLSIKQAGADPWVNISEKLKPGQLVDATITRLTNFGAFAQIFPGVEGLIHISEMSWGNRVRHPADVLAEKQKVSVSIISVDENKRNVSCSLKDIADDPWKDIEERFPAGTTVQGKVASKTRYGYFIDIAEGVTGLLAFGKIAEDKKSAINAGDSIEVGIESVDTERRRISLTFGMAEAVQAQKEVRQYVALQQEKKPSPASSEFADKLLAALKGKAS